MICCSRKAISNILGKICFLWRKTPESTRSFDRGCYDLQVQHCLNPRGKYDYTHPWLKARGKYRNIFPKCSPIVSIHTPLLLLLPVAVSLVWPEKFSNERSGWLLRSLLSDAWESWFGILKLCIFQLDKLDYLAYPDHHDILIILVILVLPGSSSPRLSATPF